MRTAIAPGLYEDSETGSYLRRPVEGGKRTWRVVKEGETEAPRTVRALVEMYLAAGAPTRRGRQYADPAAVSANLRRISAVLGNRSPASLSVADCMAYGKARGADRAADVELQSLSGALNWAAMNGHIAQNPIRSRFRIQSSDDVRHCRESMPADAEELHTIARELFCHPLSRCTAWQLLFEAFTGLRTSEILALRTDAKSKADPGWVEGSYLYVRRAKAGQFPFVPIHAALRTLLEWHRAWWQEECHDSPWYFPGRDLRSPIGPGALTRRLRDVCVRLKLPHRTSHGMRAFFVTVLRSQGRSDSEVSALIGDRTVALIQSTYGALPEVWAGGEPLDFMPRKCLPAWRNEP